MVRRFDGMMPVAGHPCRWFQQQQQRWLVLFLLALVLLGQQRTVVCSAMTTTTVMESENDDREDSPLTKHAVPITDDDELLVASASAAAVESALEPNEDATAVNTEQDPKSADMNNVEERCRWGERCHTTAGIGHTNSNSNSNTQPSLLPLQNKSDPNNDHEQHDPNNNDHHVPPLPQQQGSHGGGATTTASTTITTTGETNSGALPFVPPVKSSLGNNNNNKAKKQATHPETASVREYSASSLEDSASSSSASSTGGSSTGTGHTNIHVNHNSNHHPHGPPEGFTLTAKIFTDPEDGHSYFALPESNEEDFIIPYLECGAVGSTSWPIPVRSGAFRHFPVGAKPSLWSNDSGNGHVTDSKPHSTLSPQLIVVLHNAIEITVSGNSEERRIFEPGSVILSLDTVGRGHKLRAATHSTDDPKQHQQQQLQHMGDLNVLILTLPHHYHPPPSSSRRSVDLHLSLFGLFRKDGGTGKLKWGSKAKAVTESPCLDVDGSTQNEEEKPYYSTTNANANANNAIHHHHSSCNDGMKFLNQEGMSPVPPLRRILFGILGGGLGGLFSYWISQIAPQILAVVVGGGGVIYFFVWGTIMGGEWAVDQWQVMGEERRFSKQVTNEESPPSTTSSNPPSKMEP
eukprot:scaffold23954_cov54-Attheya_sp.AAC.1